MKCWQIVIKICAKYEENVQIGQKSVKFTLLDKRMKVCRNFIIFLKLGRCKRMKILKISKNVLKWVLVFGRKYRRRYRQERALENFGNLVSVGSLARNAPSWRYVARFPAGHVCGQFAVPWAIQSHLSCPPCEYVFFVFSLFSPLLNVSVRRVEQLHSLLHWSAAILTCPQSFRKKTITNF